MTTTPTTIFLTALTIFLLGCVGQQKSIKDDGVTVNLDPDTQKKLAILADSLTGEWELIQIKNYVNGDTIAQAPSAKPGNTETPLTTIVFDSAQSFKISQLCMKCPMLEYSGQYTVEIKSLKGLGFFYLTFIDKRDKSFTKNFNGHLTNFENNTFQLTDERGYDWTYKRILKQ